jgi:hypothetical protein
LAKGARSLNPRLRGACRAAQTEGGRSELARMGALISDLSALASTVQPQWPEPRPSTARRPIFIPAAPKLTSTPTPTPFPAPKLAPKAAPKLAAPPAPLTHAGYEIEILEPDPIDPWGSDPYDADAPPMLPDDALTPLPDGITDE